MDKRDDREHKNHSILAIPVKRCKAHPSNIQHDFLQLVSVICIAALVAVSAKFHTG